MRRAWQIYLGYAFVAIATFVLFFTFRGVLALGLSASLWLLVAAVPQVAMPNFVAEGVGTLNPFSWQFLFCIGLWVGKHYYLDEREFHPARWLQAICWVIVLANLVTHHSGRFGLGSLIEFERDHAGFHESREQLLPLTHFLSILYLTASYLRSGSALLGRAWVAPLRLCGRHSLEVFCVGVVLSKLGEIALGVYGSGIALQLAVNLTGLAAMTGVALSFERRRALRRLQLLRSPT